MSTFTISGVFDANNQYRIDAIKIGDKNVELTPITKESPDDVLNSVKNAIAELLKPASVSVTNEVSGSDLKEEVNQDSTQGGRRKTSKRKYKNNKRK